MVSRNRSCFSSRARFFLYFANCFPLASTHGHARSFWCMIAETANLATVLNVVKEPIAIATLANPIIIKETGQVEIETG